MFVLYIVLYVYIYVFWSFGLLVYNKIIRYCAKTSIKLPIFDWIYSCIMILRHHHFQFNWAGRYKLTEPRIRWKSSPGHRGQWDATEGRREDRTANGRPNIWHEMEHETVTFKRKSQTINTVILYTITNFFVRINFSAFPFMVDWSLFSAVIWPHLECL